MGKQFSEVELDQVQAWKAQGMAATDIHERLARARAPARDRGPSLRSVQRALKGTTFRRVRVETRGRKEVLTLANLRALGRAHGSEVFENRRLRNRVANASLETSPWRGR